MSRFHEVLGDPNIDNLTSTGNPARREANVYFICSRKIGMSKIEKNTDDFARKPKNSKILFVYEGNKVIYVQSRED